MAIHTIAWPLSNKVNATAVGTSLVTRCTLLASKVSQWCCLPEWAPRPHEQTCLISSAQHPKLGSNYIPLGPSSNYSFPMSVPASPCSHEKPNDQVATLKTRYSGSDLHRYKTAFVMNKIPGGNAPPTGPCPYLFYRRLGCCRICDLGMVKQVDYVYCNDLLSVEYATHTLADSPVLIIDCEGRNIGALGGALSLMCIGTERGEQIFVFDVPALKPFKLHLQPLFRTLANSAVKKVMWDCRNDFLEIQSEYNVMMTGIVDLQLAEIRARTTVKKEGDFQRKWRFTRGGRPVPLQSIDQNPELFFEVHRLQGMDACIRQLGLPTTRKDPEVAAMHGAAGSSIWMDRPLPPKLLTYAARDIEQIGALYEYFEKSAWITPTDEPLLVAQSMRYAYSLFCRGRVPDDDPFGQCAVLPLDVLSESPGPKVQCHGCHRMQSLTCYSVRKQGGWSETRTNICRACQIELLMKRTKYPITWIAVERQM